MELSESQKLAAEYQQSANSAVVDWATVPELSEYSYTPEPTSSFDSDSDSGSTGTGTGKSTKVAKVMYFDQLVEEYGRLGDEISFRESRQKELKDALTAAILMSGKEKVSCEGYKLGMVEKKGSKKILPELLISQGVTPDQIAKATTVSAASSYLDIRKYKEKV
jgi:hypothetical protein